MATDYNSLLGQMINSPYASPSDRERMVALLLRDHDDKYVTKEQLQQIINIHGEIKSPFDQKKGMPDPRQTYEFLSLFTKNDGGLKNLTHVFNYDFVEYDEFMNNCKNEFEEAKTKYPKVPIYLLTRIEHFAFKQEPNWYIREGNTKRTINLGWSKPSFVEWYNKNRIHPALDAYFNTEMIVPFKESIQVRADTGNLMHMINRIADITFGNPRCCNVEIMKNVSAAQFYTDVDNLGQALYQIFSTIKEYSERNFCNDVIIDYATEKVFKKLIITHVDSAATKNVSDPDFAGGNTEAIKKALSGLCNYEVVAKFKDGVFRKIFLSDNYEEYKKGVFPVEEQSVEGYTHVLKFY